MILAEKIILLRKKNGWSQEELADQLHVSRQAVSKWESAQSVPDLTSQGSPPPLRRWVELPCFSGSSSSH